MTQEPSGWYADPTARHVYRYWNGIQWTDQVTDGGRAGLDPIPVEPQLAITPPGPGTQAPGQAEPPPPSSRPSRNPWVMIVIVLVVVLAGAAVIAAIANSSDSDGGDPDSPTTVETAPPTSETPRTTEAPPTSETSEAE